MKAQDELHPWIAFQDANRYRRAIRNFNSTPIAKEDIQALLTEAAMAPSSGNLQPYQLHWIRDPALKVQIALACNGQKAATSAAELIIIVASPVLGKRTAEAQLQSVEASVLLNERSKVYHRKQIDKFRKILGVGSSALWSPIFFMATLLRPALSLLPIGPAGSRQWAARSAIFAAQTLMLAAAVKGIDSCPMEGFSATKVTKLLQLPRGSVIPLVIALGYRSNDWIPEERWRLPLSDIVISH